MRLLSSALRIQHVMLNVLSFYIIKYTSSSAIKTVFSQIDAELPYRFRNLWFLMLGMRNMSLRSQFGPSGLVQRGVVKGTEKSGIKLEIESRKLVSSLANPNMGGERFTVESPDRGGNKSRQVLEQTYMQGCETRPKTMMVLTQSANSEKC